MPNGPPELKKKKERQRCWRPGVTTSQWAQKYARAEVTNACDKLLSTTTGKWLNWFRSVFFFFLPVFVLWYVSSQNVQINFDFLAHRAKWPCSRVMAQLQVTFAKNCGPGARLCATFFFSLSSFTLIGTKALAATIRKAGIQVNAPPTTTPKRRKWRTGENFPWSVL